jgi:hypothetical protein
MKAINGNKAREYKRKDLRSLAFEFRKFWKVEIPENITEPRRIGSVILDSVGKEIRELLLACGCINTSRQHPPEEQAQRSLVVTTPATAPETITPTICLLMRESP